MYICKWILFLVSIVLTVSCFADKEYLIAVLSLVNGVIVLAKKDAWLYVFCGGLSVALGIWLVMEIAYKHSPTHGEIVSFTESLNNRNCDEPDPKYNGDLYNIIWDKALKQCEKDTVAESIVDLSSAIKLKLPASVSIADPVLIELFNLSKPYKNVKCIDYKEAIFNLCPERNYVD